jgi:hypothetical protein
MWAGKTVPFVLCGGPSGCVADAEALGPWCEWPELLPRSHPQPSVPNWVPQSVGQEQRWVFLRCLCRHYGARSVVALQT